MNQLCNHQGLTISWSIILLVVNRLRLLSC